MTMPAAAGATAPLVLLVLAVAQLVPVLSKDNADAEFEELEKANRNRGYAAGISGEFFRYKHIFHKQPSLKDKDEAFEAVPKIRCDVCAAIVGSLVAKAKSFSEDDISDVLEASTDYEETGDLVTDRMLQHKKGCNKHFKDELVAEGYTIQVCKDVVPGRSDSDPCLVRTGDKPSEQAVDTYELWKEILFYACEQTVGHYNDELAEYLTEALPGAENRTAVARRACETRARCRDVPRPRGATKGKKAEL
mmetsp:Transcript_119791/g.339505  ORF Transcript_119791/g.339505 Transcript_119791/m.339505 type:complete len:249 (-) Transcript_119791:58-804(-)